MESTGILRFDECDIKMSPNKERRFSEKEYNAIVSAVTMLSENGIICLVANFTFDFSLDEKKD